MNTLDSQYINLIKDILENGYLSGDRTGTGTKKVFGRMITHDMSEGVALLTCKKMFIRGGIYELLWFLKGDTNIKYLVDNNVNIWVGDCYKKYINDNNVPIQFLFNKAGKEPCVSDDFYRHYTREEFIDQIKTNDEFAKIYGELNKVYGSEWVNWNDEINQIQELIDTLKTNPDSRRLMVTAWNPSNVRNATLPPCHFAFQCFTRELSLEERIKLCKIDPETVCKNDTEIKLYLAKENIPTREISLMFQMRSTDYGLGLPADLLVYSILLSMIAQVVNMIPGELKCVTGDSHIYADHIEPIKELLTRKTYPLAKLKLNPDITNIFDFKFEDIKVVNYQSSEKLYLPLSN